MIQATSSSVASLSSCSQPSKQENRKLLESHADLTHIFDQAIPRDQAQYSAEDSETCNSLPNQPSRESKAVWSNSKFGRYHRRLGFAKTMGFHLRTINTPASLESFTSCGVHFCTSSDLPGLVILVRLRLIAERPYSPGQSCVLRSCTACRSSGCRRFKFVTGRDKTRVLSGSKHLPISLMTSASGCLANIAENLETMGYGTDSGTTCHYLSSDLLCNPLACSTVSLVEHMICKPLSSGSTLP